MAYKKYMVKEGDCISSIAFKYGFFPDTVWNDSKNSDLKRERMDPNILLPGDTVYIRDKEEKEESCDSDQRHHFRRKGVPEVLRVQLCDEADKPLANAGYTINIDGDLRTDLKTDSEGWVKQSIPPNAKEAIITLTKTMREYRLALGHLEPVESIKGVQARLDNMGYYCGDEYGEFGKSTRAALRDFQANNGLTLIDDNSDEIGMETLKALEKAHLS
ncbi:MAG: PGRP and LysM peptidoglycan-binding domain-containing protein [Planctomycetota bacterium]